MLSSRVSNLSSELISDNHSANTFQGTLTEYKIQTMALVMAQITMKGGTERTSKMSMEGWWMVQTMVRPVLTMLRTVRITIAAALASSPVTALCCEVILWQPQSNDVWMLPIRICNSPESSETLQDLGLSMRTAAYM